MACSFLLLYLFSTDASKLKVAYEGALFVRAKTSTLQQNKMRVILAILLLSTLTVSISQLAYGFSAAANNVVETPSFSLGSISQGTTVNIKIQIAYSGFTISGSSVQLSVMDSSNANVIQTVSNSMQCSGSVCSVNWTVPSTASYYLQVQDLTSIAQSRLVIYYLTASSTTATYLKVTDVLRQNVIKQFYIGTAGYYPLTLTPASSSSFYLTLLTMDPSDSLHLRVSSAADLTPTNTSNNIHTYNLSLAVGYYSIIVHTATTSSVSVKYYSDTYSCPYSSSYQNYYAIFSGCSFSTTTTVSSSAFPCTSYDYANSICVGCASGYSLSQGQCTLNTTCAARQYYSYGTCINVSETCGQFDAYTGVCVTCANAAYYLSSGQCIAVSCGLNLYYSISQSTCISLPVGCANFSISTELCSTCSAGYYLYNGNCNQNAKSANCRVFNFDKNTCTSCNSGYSLQSGACSAIYTCPSGQSLVNGICILNQSTCSSNQVLINSQCVQLPANCLSINVYYQCTQCAQNYQMIAGYCQRCTGSNANYPCVTCPEGQYINSNGVCQSLASVYIRYCQTYSASGNSCQTCNNGQAPSNNVCCDTGQQLSSSGQCTTQQSSSSSGSNLSGGFSNTFKIYGYCASLNVLTKTCTACLTGHTLVGNYCP